MWNTNCVILDGDCSIVCNFRAITVFPDNFLGVIGQHESELVVESLSLSADTNHVVSYGGDQTIRFWNIGFLDHMRMPDHSTRKRLNRNLPSSRYQDPRHFYNDLRTRTN